MLGDQGECVVDSQPTIYDVAERAGVSVGTLYQYFPNRQALIRAVLERYLMEMSASIQADCQTLRGRSLDEIARGWSTP